MRLVDFILKNWVLDIEIFSAISFTIPKPLLSIMLVKELLWKRMLILC